MTSKHVYNFGIHSSKHKKVLDIFDQWEKQGLNFSDEICKAIKLYQANKERGSKMDQFIEPKELIQLPRINQELKDEDIGMLVEAIGTAELHRIGSLMGYNSKKILDVVFSEKTYAR